MHALIPFRSPADASLLPSTDSDDRAAIDYEHKHKWSHPVSVSSRRCKQENTRLTRSFRFHFEATLYLTIICTFLTLSSSLKFSQLMCIFFRPSHSLFIGSCRSGMGSDWIQRSE